MNPEYTSLEQVEASPPTRLIDVRLEPEFAAAHLPGAISNCVFEVAFSERINEQAPAKEESVVVYGADENSYEAPVASEKLKRLGYTNVKVLAGGIEEWIRNGRPVEGSGETAGFPAVEDGEYTIHIDDSRLQWTGRNLLNRHWGTIGLKSGALVIQDGIPVSGEFVIDMNRIHCTDLAGDATHDVLIHHLKSDDFFDVEQFPETKVTILGSEPISRTSPGAPNLSLNLNVRIKDVRSMITIPVTAGVTPDGKLAAQGTFSFDRTMWEVIYGSGRFFRNVGMHLVNDLIDMDVKIVTA